MFDSEEQGWQPKYYALDNLPSRRLVDYARLRPFSDMPHSQPVP